ncbi:MAG: hypothetical protein KC776_30490 [Myxococcales bacterium]|nr:hypothetical protein [Myxococcales bacterium]MCB9581268.1 hypothetical protein [Polyangiaceae bacterium]
MMVQERGRALDAGGHYPLFPAGDHREPGERSHAVALDDGVGDVSAPLASFGSEIGRCLRA